MHTAYGYGRNGHVNIQDAIHDKRLYEGSEGVGVARDVSHHVASGRVGSRRVESLHVVKYLPEQTKTNLAAS